jgi:hypothetical protein
MYLVNVTIGEENAYGHSCAQDTCEIKQTYQFNREVWMQCVINILGEKGTWWSSTTDFWESPEGDCE